MAVRDSQRNVIDFLSAPDCPAYRVHLPSEATYCSVRPIEIVQTHSAYVFIGERIVCKIKRAVSYSYLDMQALETRHRLCHRELELNQAVLPDIYIDVVPVYRSAEGELSMRDTGVPLEWVLRMYRFEQSQVLDTIAREQRLDSQLARQLGVSMARYHQQLPPRHCHDGWQRIREIIDELDHEFSLLAGMMDRHDTRHFVEIARAHCDRHRALLDQRAAEGLVRRCHGDLHLRNILLKDGQAVPFDALEFDERLATTDVFYDIAFLIMDIGHRHLHAQQNQVLNNYLLQFDPGVFDGLALLPLFLALRAAVRAMTTAQAAPQDAAASAAIGTEARVYLDAAIASLDARNPKLVLIGGLSGTGKSTLAEELAGQLVAPPGALLLQTDAERKALRGADRHATLQDSHYSSDARERIYQRLIDKARRALRSGFTVILDATWLSAADRARAAALAEATRVPLRALWLDAPVAILRQRVDERSRDSQRQDASDATVNVLERQIELCRELPVGWTAVDASGPPAHTLRHALRALKH